MLCGLALGGLALLVAVVQLIAWRLDRRRIRFLPQALGATAAAFLTALWLVLASEFRWVDGQWLDDAAPWIVGAMLGWMGWNRMGSRRNRRELEKLES